MIAPPKLLVVRSTGGLSGKEGPALEATPKYGLTITGIFSMVTLIANKLF